MKLKYSKFQIITELFTVVLLALMWVYLIVCWTDIPNKIPEHYNLAGTIDHFGSKNEIFIGPIISTVLYIILTGMSFYPSTWVTWTTRKFPAVVPVIVTDEERKSAYFNIKNMIILIKMEIIIAFAHIFYCTVKIHSLGIWSMPLTLIVFLGTVLYFRLKINNEKRKVNV